MMAAQRPQLPCLTPSSRSLSVKYEWRHSNEGYQQNSSYNRPREKPHFNEPPSPVSLVNGLFAVDKPPGWTSNDVTVKVRNLLSKHVASLHPHLRKNQCRLKGVLVLGVGSSTKKLGQFLSSDKCYTATGLFGFETDTCDAEGVKVGEAKSFDHVTDELLTQILQKFQGNIMQVPPVYSAIKINGTSSYKRALRGEEVVMTARQILIHSITLTKPFSETKPSFHIEVSCGSGTYVRSLVRDIARELDTAAHMSSLERTRQGQFTLQNSLGKDEFYDVERVLQAISNSSMEGLDATPTHKVY